MKVLACGAIPIATVKMTIGELLPTELIEGNEGSLKGFWVSIPRGLSKKLAVGDTVSVVCTINKDLTFGTETLALKIHTSESSSTVLYDRNNYAEMLRM